MLETKCVGDNFQMLVTVWALFVAKILYLLTLASSINIQKMSPISKFSHQHPLVTNIYVVDLYRNFYDFRVGKRKWYRYEKILQRYKAKILGFTLPIAIYWLQNELEIGCKYHQNLFFKWQRYFSIHYMEHVWHYDHKKFMIEKRNSNTI